MLSSSFRPKFRAVSVLGARQERRVDDALLQRGDQRRYLLQVSKFHIDVRLEAVLHEQHMSRDIGGRAFIRRAEGFARQCLDVRMSGLL